MKQRMTPARDVTGESIVSRLLNIIIQLSEDYERASLLLGFEAERVTILELVAEYRDQFIFHGYRPEMLGLLATDFRHRKRGLEDLATVLDMWEVIEWLEGRLV